MLDTSYLVAQRLAIGLPTILQPFWIFLMSILSAGLLGYTVVFGKQCFKFGYLYYQDHISEEFDLIDLL